LLRIRDPANRIVAQCMEANVSRITRSGRRPTRTGGQSNAGCHKEAKR
jgi:hypothetical protein